MQSSQNRQPSRTRRLPRRATDRIEDAAAWALTAAALFVLLGALFGGVCVYVEQGRAKAQQRTPVDAVLVDDTGFAMDPVPFGAAGPLTLRTARYVDAAGTGHQIVLTVAGRPQSGAVVRAWIDRDGRVVEPPASRTGAVVLGTCAAVGMVLLGALVLGGTWSGLRRCVDLRNAHAWEREWVRVEPEWSGR